MSYPAFDLDGVICPDVKWDGDTSSYGIKRLHSLRSNIYPIFYPSGPFFIVTGRPKQDREETWNWLNEHEIRPTDIFFMDNDLTKWGTVTIVEHKSRIINSMPIKYFVESEKRQADMIREGVSVPVIHFSEFIKHQLEHSVKVNED